MPRFATLCNGDLTKTLNQMQGVCATALKRACRKLGVKKWPYRDQQGKTQRAPSPQEDNMEAKIHKAAAATAASAASRDVLLSMGIDVRRAEDVECDSPSNDSTDCSSPDCAEPASENVVDMAQPAMRAPCPAPQRNASPQVLQSACHPAHTKNLQQAKDLNGCLEISSFSNRQGTLDGDQDVDGSSCFSDEQGDDQSSSSSSSSRPSSPKTTFVASRSDHESFSSMSPFASLAYLSAPANATAKTHPAAACATPNSARVQRQAVRPKATVAGFKSTAMQMSVAPSNPLSSSAVALTADWAGEEMANEVVRDVTQDSSNVIFPRRKQGQHKKHGRKEGVVVTMEILETVFHMPLHKACHALGVCATALKRACRKLGVQKWPYRDQQCQTHRSVGSSMDEDKEALSGTSSSSRAAPCKPQPQRARVSSGMRVGALGTSTMEGSRTDVSQGSYEFNCAVEGQLSRFDSSSNLHARSREHSSDVESSVDTQIQDRHSSISEEHGAEVPCSQDVVGHIMPPHDVWGAHTQHGCRMHEYADKDEDFDSFDSEEDGFMAAQSWEHELVVSPCVMVRGFSDSRLDNILTRLDTVGTPGALLLEDCLKV